VEKLKGAVTEKYSSSIASLLAVKIHLAADKLISKAVNEADLPSEEAASLLFLTGSSLWS
jgi:hypothetical protein